jgi:glycosyltransferase involved in cell wall biosynthesis
MQWSIVIPTYNSGRFIERCLLSIVDQQSDDYEIVVVDDGSTDDTRKVIDRFCREHGVPSGRLKYIFQSNQGPAEARNRGIAESRGSFVWFLDSDDRLAPGAFEHMRAAVERNPDGELFFGGYRSVAQDGSAADKLPGALSCDRTENFRRFLFKELKSLTTGAVAVRKTCLRDIRFPVGVHINEDVVFFGHLIARCETVAVGEIVVEKLRHPASLRDNFERIEESGLRSVDYLFDAGRLTSGQMKLRPVYLANRCLRLFRSHYRHGNYARARGYYLQALRTLPRYLFKGAYLLKFLRCLGK